MSNIVIMIVIIAAYTALSLFIANRVEKLSERLVSLERIVFDNRDAIDHPEKDVGKYWKGKI